MVYPRGRNEIVGDRRRDLCESLAARYAGVALVGPLNHPVSDGALFQRVTLNSTRPPVEITRRDATSRVSGTSTGKAGQSALHKALCASRIIERRGIIPETQHLSHLPIV